MSTNLDTTIALVTTTSMNAYMGIATSSTEEGECDLVINAASKFAMMYCGRSNWLTTTLTEYYDGDNTDTLYLKSPPINSVTSIHIDDSVPRDWSDTDDLVDSDEYLTYSEEGKVVLDGDIYVQGKRNVKVIYSGGYGTVPADLQQAVKELVAFWYKRNTDKRVGVTNVSVGDKSTSYEGELPRAVKMVLDRYRLKWRFIA
jgi:hypothetical protein